MATPKILIIYTGGTIGMGKDPVTGVLEPLDFNHLVSSMPEFKLIQAEIDVRKFDPPIDSSDMDPMRWAEIVSMIANNYNDYDGFVILHGTDTMAYTSSALSFMLENLTKPVILTGSQLPIGELRTDGKENLMTAIEIASAKDENGRPMVPEVCIFFNGKLIRGNRAIKINAEGFHAFESFNYPHLCDVGINPHSGLRQADDTPPETRPERDRVQSLPGHPGQHRAPRDGIARSARHRDAYLRFGKRPSFSMDHATAGRSSPPRREHREHQPVPDRQRGDGEIRRRIPVEDFSRNQRPRLYGRGDGNEDDVSARQI